MPAMRTLTQVAPLRRVFQTVVCLLPLSGFLLLMPFSLHPVAQTSQAVMRDISSIEFPCPSLCLPWGHVALLFCFGVNRNHVLRVHELLGDIGNALQADLAATVVVHCMQGQVRSVVLSRVENLVVLLIVLLATQLPHD